MSDFPSWVAAVVFLFVLGSCLVNDFSSLSGNLRVGHILSDFSHFSWSLLVYNSLFNSWLLNILGSVFLGVSSSGLYSAFNSLGFKGLIGVVDNLSLNRDVFVSDLFLGNLNIFNFLFRNVLRNVLSKILNGIVVGNSDLTRDGLNFSFFLVFDSLDLLGNSLDFGLILVLNDLLLEWNVFDPAFSLDDFFASVDGGSNNFGSGAGDGDSSSNSSLNSLNSLSVS